MSASRKLHTEIAASIRAHVETCATASDDYGRGGQHAVAALARMIATDLELDNPRFDRARFLAACGVAELPIDVVIASQNTGA